ncbi:unnamed protein product [Symbiodinium necroappetens]|uniref:Uncharacterized protein n=1 Tax=Symbiodinium necroappetens TaxID=1628268 RepID=A0A813CAU0_9DINO|nr:unnamed protein product [Symbiodinium necroappetens]
MARLEIGSKGQHPDIVVKDAEDGEAADTRKGPSVTEKPHFQMSASAEVFHPTQRSIEEKIRSAFEVSLVRRGNQESGGVAEPRGYDPWAAWASGCGQSTFDYTQAYAYSQCYDPSSNNQMAYLQGPHWQQPQLQYCWAMTEGVKALHGADCYNGDSYYCANYCGYGQDQVPIQRASYTEGF